MEKKMQKFDTGTTTVGIIGKSAVVLAADKQATMGYLKASKEAQKIFKLDDHVGLTIAGSVGDAQRLIRWIRSELKLYKLEADEMSVKAVSTLLANILHSSRFMPFFNQFITAGVDKSGPVLYDLDMGGGLMEHRDYVSTGSGSVVAYGVLEDSFKKDLNDEDIIKLAIRSIKAASERDINSGEGISVAVIGESGYKELTPKEIEKYL